ncbi:protein phosphatase 1F [Drosophila grimshawi]|uniref:GH10165 n=1 Tax=Drosophila grimshawi TaxID=7222 RepID=B4JBZ2_DROGR|nr:protein phosphatase 1F [Drosophila grimshawi]EDW04095.1 GH10165 [Drosophila grimshawi]
MSTDADAATKCARLLKFKEFLARSNSNNKSGEQNAANELARNGSCVTRSSNDTYKVTGDERRAEIVAAIWKQLNTRGCPQGFQLKLLHSAREQVEHEIRHAKEFETNLDVAEPQYDLLKLQKYVATQLDKLLLTLTDNAALEKLQLYADDGILCTEPGSCQCGSLDSQPPTCSAAAIKNKPRKMEDRHVCLERFGAIYQLKNHPDCRFFGVFDGHSGALSASYVTSQLPQLLAEQLRRAPESMESNADFYRTAFETAFLQADERFARKRITSGTTAVCGLITDDRQLYIAWVGDSKALLVGERTQLQLVKPHKPEAVDERRRIELCGGSVIHAQGQWRVNGILNVGRSIGDYCLEAVIAEPDFVDVPLSEAHDFLVLGSDGLWDHVPEAFIVDTVYECLADPQTKLDDIPKLLVEAAKERDSQDNITCILVLLKPRLQIGPRLAN